VIKFKSKKAIKEYLSESNLEALTIDDHDKALIGVCETFNGYVAIYDPDIIIETLMKQGMDYEEAEEFFRYNIIGAYMGEYTPIYLTGIQWESKNRKKKHTK